jgi:hypothetical protein
MTITFGLVGGGKDLYRFWGGEGIDIGCTVRTCDLPYSVVPRQGGGEMITCDYIGSTPAQIGIIQKSKVSTQFI